MVIKGIVVAVQVFHLVQRGGCAVLQQTDVEVVREHLVDLDAAIAVDGMAFARDQLKCADRIHDTGHARADLLHILSVEQEAKLVRKAVVIQLVRPERAGQDAGHAAQQAVPDGKAERGVDKLEPMQVEQHQRVVFVAGELLGCKLHKFVGIVCAGDVVVVSQMFNFLGAGIADVAGVQQQEGEHQDQQQRGRHKHEHHLPVALVDVRGGHDADEVPVVIAERAQRPPVFLPVVRKREGIGRAGLDSLLQRLIGHAVKGDLVKEVGLLLQNIIDCERDIAILTHDKVEAVRAEKRLLDDGGEGVYLAGGGHHADDFLCIVRDGRCVDDHIIGREASEPISDRLSSPAMHAGRQAGRIRPARDRWSRPDRRWSLGSPG